MEGGLNNAPLPNEVPSAPDLSRVPIPILHTGTVETLIGHSEDLTARLMVHIRRNAVLEGQLIEQERAVNEMSRTNGTLVSQLEILQEKDRIWRDKSSQIDDRHEALRGTVDDLNTLVDQLENQNGQLRTAVTLLLGFQRRVRQWVRPLIDQLAQALITEQAARHVADAKVSDLRKHLTDTTADLRALEVRSSRDQTKLVEQYEARLAQLQGLHDKAHRFDEAVKAKTELENKVVLLERRRADSETALATELRTMKTQMTEYRQEAKALASENLGLKSDLERKTIALQTLEEQFIRLQDQFESVQAVWADSQKRLEAAKLQHETLNKLNQELSRQLRERRADEASPPAANA